MSRRRVLILCTGNSCRSHMAEGLVNYYRGDAWEAFSAGTEPSGYVHPMAIAAMAEVDIDISNHTSKSTGQFRNVPLDWVITVCDDAAEKCPIWLGQGQKMHIPFPDPAKATGDEAVRMAVFRQVRDAIREEVLAFLESV